MSRARLGFNVLPTKVARNRDEALNADHEYPLILKPADAISLKGGRLTKGRNSICANPGRAGARRHKMGWTGAFVNSALRRGRG